MKDRWMWLKVTIAVGVVFLSVSAPVFFDMLPEGARHSFDKYFPWYARGIALICVLVILNKSAKNGEEPVKKKDWIESIILWDCYLILGFMGWLLLSGIFHPGPWGYILSIGALLLLFLLLGVNLMRYRKVLDSIPSKRGKGLFFSLREGLWEGKGKEDKK